MNRQRRFRIRNGSRRHITWSKIEAGETDLEERFRRRIEGSWQKAQMPPKYPLLQQERLLLMLVRVRWAPRRPPPPRAWPRWVRKTVRSTNAAAGWSGCRSQPF